MDKGKARDMAKSIIAEVNNKIRQQSAWVRTGVVPDIERLTNALQTYSRARYRTNPTVEADGRKYRMFTIVLVEWKDETWKVQLYRMGVKFPLTEKEEVLPPENQDFLPRRDGGLEWKETILRPDPSTGVYVPEGYRPPWDLLEAASYGFLVEVYKKDILVREANRPMILHCEDPDERVNLIYELIYKTHKAEVSLGSGELLAYLALWRMMEY